MDNFNVIQGRIKEQRKVYEAAAADFYFSLQSWSLSQEGIPAGTTKAPTQAEVEVKRAARDKALAALQVEIQSLTAAGTPQQLLEKVPANLPFLLMPLRLEARYVRIQHVVRNLKMEDAVDVCSLLEGESLSVTPGDRSPLNVAPFLTAGFKKDEEGVMTYQVPALTSSGKIMTLYPAYFEQWNPPGGMYIKRKNDRHELRIRIYPDDFFVEGHERALQPGERDAGIQFWKNICGGKDPEEEWMQFSADRTPARAAWIIRATRPQNFSEDKPLPGEPVFNNIPLKDGAYTCPPITRLLPERFVVRLYRDGQYKEFTGKTIPEPLTMGLDPTQDPFSQSKASEMTADGVTIKTPAYLTWIHNFEEAENKGLAIRIDLQQYPEYKEGVHKIVVVGAKLSADEEEASRLLNEQLENHLYKEEGLCLLPKGTPTNNFGKQRSGFQQGERDARQYFLSEWKKPAALPETDEHRLQKALGLKDGYRIPSGHVTDISEAALMNELLWPATLGYYLLQFFTPQLDETTREQARQFFIRNVSGRGTLPVLRVNRQPYGIIPVTSFKHWQYSAQGIQEEEKVAAALWTNILSKLDLQWQAITQQIKTVNNVGSQALDDNFFKMLGIAPISTVLQRQWFAGAQFQSALKYYGRGNIGDLKVNDPDFKPELFNNSLLGINIDTTLFQPLINAYGTTLKPVVRTFLDGAALSEERLLQRIPGKQWNYLEWLQKGSVKDIWYNDLSVIPAGDGPEESLAASSVLAILARQAVLRAYLETGMKEPRPQLGHWLLTVKDFEALHLHANGIFVDPAQLSASNVLHQAFKPIIDQFQIKSGFTVQPHRWSFLFYEPDEEDKADNPGFQSLATRLYNDREKIAPLQGMMKALGHFSKTPTARLQRLLAEHLDLCSHRLDAWMLGLVNQRLNKLRQEKPQGIGLGAFGYLLNLKPVAAFSNIVVEEQPEYIPATVENADNAVIPVIHSLAARQNGIDLSGDGWARTYLYIGGGTTVPHQFRLNTASGRVELDQSVGGDGFIHAPSTAHATAAAILRAGYLNHRSDVQTAQMELQLNSPRIRRALQLLEGMQQGAAVSELLGYYFERLLHENSLDGSLYNLRLAFPLKRTEAQEKESPSAMTTIDGLALLKARRANEGWLSAVSGIDPGHHEKINRVVLTLEDYLDALGDLLLAESVYQTAAGNPDKAAAAFRIMNEGGQGATPDFIQTPMKGSTIAHRIGIVLSQPLSNANWQGWRTSNSARALLCPDINHWLIRQLPSPASIAMVATLPNNQKTKLRLSDMLIDPIDLIYALPASFTEMEQSPLALYFQSALHQKNGPKFLSDRQKIVIDFKDRSLHTDAELTIFEISSLVTALRKIITDSRPLSANDFLLPDKSTTDDKTDATRLNASMKKHVLENTLIAQIAKDLRDQASQLNTAIQQKQAEGVLQPLVAALLKALLTAWQQGVETSGTGGVYFLQNESAAGLIQKALEVAAALESRLEKARQLMTAIPASSSGAPLFTSLQEVAAGLLGSNIKLLPDVVLENAVEVNTCYKNRTLIEHAGADAIDEWTREAVLVRAPLRVYRRAALLGETLSPEKVRPPFEVLQFPFFTEKKQAWAGGRIGKEIPPEERPVVSLLLELPAAYDAGKKHAGFIIDEWPEWIPEPSADTGVAFQYNQPNTEPPQTMLLAVAPVEGGNWKWEYLAEAVNDALDLSKKRLVTPANIRDGNTGLHQVLPAIVLPFMKDNQQIPVVQPLGTMS